MERPEVAQKLAVWAVTPRGAELALNLAGSLPNADLYLSASLPGPDISATFFDRLSAVLSEVFHRYRGHVFIMSTGIVVRMIAPLLRRKTEDPAVVVMNETGAHAISLLSGHLGGANRLAERVAAVSGAEPVITTATDLNQAPAIDLIAQQEGLFIETPGAIKKIGMALLTGRTVRLHDPFGRVRPHLPAESVANWKYSFKNQGEDPNNSRASSYVMFEETPGIFVDDIQVDPPPNVLVLRPRSLTAGMGCNRNTGMAEMKALLLETLNAFGLSPRSLKGIASVDIKRDEPGLAALGAELGLDLVFFDRDTLQKVTAIQRPSAMVKKHIGVESVCEAAAILGANHGSLIVPKQKTRNVTVAVARTPYSSSASAPADSSISAGGRSRS
ncbi:MAG: cobalt-precorrin 5A hydrolase [Thermodesulfobacteriota bacterium]